MSTGLLDIGDDSIALVLDHLAATDIARLAAIDFFPALLIERLRRRAAVRYNTSDSNGSSHMRFIASRLAFIEWLSMRRNASQMKVAPSNLRSFVVASGGILVSCGDVYQLHPQNEGGYVYNVPTRIPSLGEDQGDGTPIVEIRSIISGKKWQSTRTLITNGVVRFITETPNSVFNYIRSQFQVALSVTGVVYTWNEGTYCFSGQLGHTDTMNTSVPRRVETLIGYNVVSVAAGSHHCIAVTSIGEIFSWGVNSDGQCGYDYNESDEPELQLTPRRVLIGENAMARGASAGYMHSLVVTVDGNIYAFGSNTKGQLGLGIGDRNVFRPKKVVEMNRRVVSVAAGSMHSLALSECGLVFSWGDNEFRQLSRPIGTHVRLNNLPVKVAGLSEVHISIIVAGGTQSGAVSDTGVLFTWGFSANGSLGHGEVTTQKLPRAVVGVPPVVAVSIDSTHAIVVTSNGSVYAWGRSENFGIHPIERSTWDPYELATASPPIKLDVIV